MFFQKGSCLKDIREGEMRLWHSKGDIWRPSSPLERVFYKIDWEARMAIRGQRSCKVSGSWIQSTLPSVLRKLLGKEYEGMADKTPLDEDTAQE